MVIIQNTSTSIMHHQTHPEPSHDNPQVFTTCMQKGEETRFRFEVVLHYDYCLFVFAFANVCLAWIYYEADYHGKTNVVKFCLIVLEIVTILQIFVTVFRYRSQLQLQKSQKVLQQQQGLRSSGKIFQLLFQCLTILIKPYIFLNSYLFRTMNIYDKFQFEYKINYVLVVIGFLKIYIGLRVLLIKQIYMSPRSNRLCRMYGAQHNYLYVVKCLFKDTPLTLIGIAFGISLLIFSICLRIAQRNLVIQYPKHFNGMPYPGNIENIENAIWLTIITMTTVGYGDYFPRTQFGRSIDCLLVVWGSFIVSLMVVVLTNTLNMDQAEKRALIVLNRLQAKKGLKDAAAYLITHSCKRHLKNKKIQQKLLPPLTDSERARSQQKFYQYLSNFQNVHRQIRSMYQIDDVYEQMTRQFQVINDQINQLLETQKSTLVNLHKKSKKIVTNSISQIFKNHEIQN